jgi:WD40 repeat protein
MNQTGLSQTDTFYITGGNVPADALSYVTRDADALLLQRLLQGEFCYILTSRQMGKSSLMTQMVKQLREHHVAPAVLDLSNQGFNLDARQWYNGLLEQLGRRLKLDDEIEDFCGDHRSLSPLQLWQQALRDVVLEAMPDQQVVIFIDEIDVVRSLPFSTDEFFAAIRACYNARTEDPTFARLSFCLLGVATPADLISNPKLTPFNIGTRIELTDFSREEAKALEVGLGQDAAVNRMLMDRIIYWTSGHPYLTQRLCEAVAADDAHLTAGSVDACAARLFLSVKAQRQDSNLSFVQQRMLPGEEEQRVGLLTLYAKVLSGKSVLDSDTVAYVSELKLAGIVQAVGGQLAVRNRIPPPGVYRAWISENMPGAELRRQRAAYRRGLVRAGAVASAIVGVMGCLTLWAIRSEQRANSFQIKSEIEKNYAERIAYIANMNLIPAAYEANQFDRIGEILEETKQEKYRAYRGFEWGYWNRLAHLDLQTLKGHTGGVDSVTFSPDGTRIVTGSYDKSVKVWDVQSGRETLTLNVDSTEIAFSPDGRHIVTASGGNTAQVWDAQTGRELLTLKGYSDSIYSVAFSRDGQHIITWSNINTAKVWDAHMGRELMAFKSHPEPMASAEFSPDGQRFVTTVGPYHSILSIVEIRTGRVLLVLKGFHASIFSVAFSPDGQRIVAGSGQEAKVWNVQTGQELTTLEHIDFVYSVAFSSDGQRIVTGSGRVKVSGEAKIWDARTGTAIRTLKGYKDIVRSVAFSPDGTRIVAGSDDKTAKVWDAWTDRTTLMLNEGADHARSVAFSPDGFRIVTGSGEQYRKPGEAKVWDAQMGRVIRTLERHAGGVNAVGFSPDGHYIVTGSGTYGKPGEAKIWDAQTSQEMLTLKGHTNAVNAVAVSSNGQQIVTGSDDKTAKVWNARTGQEMLTLKGHTNAVNAVAFSPDSQRIITGSVDQTAKVWDVQTGREILMLKGHTANVSSVAFSSDGQRIVTGSFDQTAMVWNATTGRVILTLKGHTGQIRSVAVSPDGQRIVTCSSDDYGNGELKLWDVQTGRVVLEQKGTNEGTDAWDLWSVAFSPDGRRIVTGSMEQSAKVWFSDPNDWQPAMRDADLANSHLLLAHKLVSAKKYNIAVVEYKLVLRLRPSLGIATFWDTLGWCEYLAGQIDDAIKSYCTALRKDPTLTDVRLDLGLSYATQNDWPRAKQEYDLALKGVPKANIYSGTENVQDAIKHHANPALTKALAYLKKADSKQERSR